MERAFEASVQFVKSDAPWLCVWMDVMSLLINPNVIYVLLCGALNTIKSWGIMTALTVMYYMELAAWRTGGLMRPRVECSEAALTITKNFSVKTSEDDQMVLDGGKNSAATRCSKKLWCSTKPGVKLWNMTHVVFTKIFQCVCKINTDLSLESVFSQPWIFFSLITF